MLQNLSSAAVVIGALRVMIYFVAKKKLTEFLQPLNSFIQLVSQKLMHCTNLKIKHFKYVRL